MNGWGTRVRRGVPILLLVAGVAAPGRAQESAAPSSMGREAVVRFVESYCVECHNVDDKDKAGGLALDEIGAEDLGRHPEVWEKVVRKLAARQMPPAGSLRPKGQAYDSIVGWLAGSLDRSAA